MSNIKDNFPVFLGKTDFARTPLRSRPKHKTEILKKEQMAKLTYAEKLELSKRQREALKNYIDLGMDPGKKGEAATMAGYSPSGAAGAMTRILSHKIVHERITQALEKVGINYDSLAKVLQEGMSATHPFKPDQKDFHAIHKFFKEACSLLDLYPAQRIKQEIEQRAIHIHLTADDAQAFQKYKNMRQEKEEDEPGSPS